MLPVGYTLTVYEDDGLTGDSKMYDGQEDENGRMICQDLDYEGDEIEMNDRTDSFTIVKNASPASASGDWLMIASGEATVTFEYGFETSSTTSTTTEMQEQLSYEMSIGISFSEQKLTESIAYTTSETVESTYSQSGMVTITQTCPDSPIPDDPSIGFWIWKVSTHDNLAGSISPVGFCRYGTGEWNVKPLCPQAACIDYRCNECLDWADV